MIAVQEAPKATTIARVPKVKRSNPTGTKPVRESRQDPGKAHPPSQPHLPSPPPGRPSFAIPPSASAPKASTGGSGGQVIDTSPPPSTYDPHELAQSRAESARLENNLFASSALGALALENVTSVMTLRLYFARFRREAGATTDSVERILLEQLALSHVKIAELHTLAASAKKSKQTQAFANAAARLIGCICQLTTALAAHRASRRPKFGPEFTDNAEEANRENGRRTSK